MSEGKGTHGLAQHHVVGPLPSHRALRRAMLAGDDTEFWWLAAQPRPTNGIFVAITVMNRTFASSGRPAM